MMEAQNRNVDKLAARISAYLSRRSGISLVELSRDIEGFAGEVVWGSNETNVIVWDRMSQDAIAAITGLIAEEKIVATPSNVLVYAFDGGVLDMPIATDVRRSYAKPRWLPLVFAGAREAA